MILASRLIRMKQSTIIKHRAQVNCCQVNTQGFSRGIILLVRGLGRMLDVAGVEGFLFKTDSSVCVELETRLILRIGLLWMRTGSPTADGLRSTVLLLTVDTGCVRKLSTRRMIRSELRTYELGAAGGSGGFLPASAGRTSGFCSMRIDLVSMLASEHLSNPLWMKLKSDKGSGLSWNR